MIQVVDFLSFLTPNPRAYAFSLSLSCTFHLSLFIRAFQKSVLYCDLFLTCCSCGYVFQLLAPCTGLLASHFCFLFIFKIKLPFTLLRWYYWLGSNIRYFRLFSGSDDGFILPTCIFPTWFPGNYGHSFKWGFFMLGVAV